MLNKIKIKIKINKHLKGSGTATVLFGAATVFGGTFYCAVTDIFLVANGVEIGELTLFIIGARQAQGYGFQT